jgi:opacity protein-like surface antigen
MSPATRRFCLPLLAATALLATPLAAQAESPRFEFTPFVGGRVGGGFDVSTTDGSDSSVDLGSGASFGIGLGLYRDDQSFYELLYSTQSTELDSSDPVLDGVDLRVDYLQFGGTLFFPQDSDFFVPYLSLTIGATFMEPDDGGYDSETRFSGSLGGGFRIPINDNVALNLGLRGYLTLLNSDTSLFCVSDSGEAGCLLRSSGSTFFQAEGQLGISVRF